jgi:hypothetical protein
LINIFITRFSYILYNYKRENCLLLAIKINKRFCFACGTHQE